MMEIKVKIRIKIDSITQEESYETEFSYCVIEHGSKLYICWVDYSNLVKYVGKWVICYKYISYLKVNPRHESLSAITFISFGNAMEHFLFRRGSGV